MRYKKNIIIKNLLFFFFLLVSEENKLGCQLSELPENLIYEIGKRLTIYADYICPIALNFQVIPILATKVAKPST